jgi:hypothetical protein
MMRRAAPSCFSPPLPPAPRADRAATAGRHCRYPAISGIRPLRRSTVSPSLRIAGKSPFSPMPKSTGTYPAAHLNRPEMPEGARDAEAELLDALAAEAEEDNEEDEETL